MAALSTEHTPHHPVGGKSLEILIIDLPDFDRLWLVSFPLNPRLIERFYGAYPMQVIIYSLALKGD
jgi:hypothetical protein